MQPTGVIWPKRNIITNHFGIGLIAGRFKLLSCASQHNISPARRKNRGKKKGKMKMKSDQEVLAIHCDKGWQKWKHTQKGKITGPERAKRLTIKVKFLSQNEEGTIQNYRKRKKKNNSEGHPKARQSLWTSNARKTLADTKLIPHQISPFSLGQLKRRASRMTSRYLHATTTTSNKPVGKKTKTKQ